MVVMAYTTQDRLADYGFSIEFQSGTGWRVYIVFLPYHQNHNEGSRLPYLSTDRKGRRYVDWSAEIDSLGEARTVAELWAEIAQSYQHAGARFENGSTPTTDPGPVQRLRSDAA